MTAAEILARARSTLGLKTRYVLGDGGGDPLGPVGGKDGSSDCSGAFCYWHGLRRKQKASPFYGRKYGGWINTTSIAADADSVRARSGLWLRVDWPEPGDGIVYPTIVKNGAKKIGHVGLVSKSGRTEDWKALRVIHCSSSNWRNHGDAIRETPADAWISARKAGREVLFVRWDPADEERVPLHLAV